MINFIGGPANGISLSLARAPFYLRVVIDPEGTVDALDQLEDTPKANERLVVYHNIGGYSQYHLYCGGKHRAASGWKVAGNYQLLEPQPDDATMRDRLMWGKWCTAPEQLDRFERFKIKK